MVMLKGEGSAQFSVGKVIITVEVAEELYEKLKKFGIPVSDVVRRALEREVARAEEKELETALERIGEILAKIPPGELAEAVRSSREER